MKSPIYVDASWLIALYVENHPFHNLAKRQFSECAKSKFVISHLAVDEVLHGLSKYRIKDEVIVSLLKAFVETVTIKEIILESNSASIIKYLESWVSSALAPRDAMHLFLIEDNKIKSLLTFDRELKKVSKKLGIVTY